MTEVTLEFLAHKLQQVLDDLASVKDEQMIQGALLHAMQGQLNGIASKLDRLDNRMRRLEDREPRPSV